MSKKLEPRKDPGFGVHGATKWSSENLSRRYHRAIRHDSGNCDVFDQGQDRPKERKDELEGIHDSVSPSL